ncbi:hypothetical protein [Halocella sp. SP3-1]|uniref:hypothetical protein n=1 Tax=Halocella sp. SP3-1 TaxID=2382161 RepID=UPI0013DED874|nr:hypothetical protein [Halocella sp. SP3-1]
MVDDVLINKKQTINRCIKRINEVYDNNFDNLKDYTKLSVVLPQLMLVLIKVRQ